jgi:glucose-6-phosphate 1-dehydrogenase
MSRLDPHVFVILGATGDLTSRKLVPALHRLVERRDVQTVVLGAATSDFDDTSFRSDLGAAMSEAGIDAADAAAWCATNVHYERIDRDGGYDALKDRIEAVERAHGLPGNRIFYLALPPAVFPPAIERLGAAGLAEGPGWTRLVVEKPFGRDLESATALNETVHHHFTEEQVYRIDHYLGKETVQNLLVFRFTNPLFEASWNRDRIDRVEITVSEAIDVGDRGRYYDSAGAVRDMLQSHLTQILTLVAMEAPPAADAGHIRAEKVKVLQSIHGLDADGVVLGQYTAGEVGGEPVPAYRTLDGVDGESDTPTYAAVRLHIDNWRWQGVPFYLRAGKAMERRVTEVAVSFRRPPVCYFHAVPDACVDHSDVLYLTLQPEEGFSLEIEVKEPGNTTRLRTIPLRFSYSEAFGEIPEAYETLLEDIIEGDQTLFVRADEVEQSWRLFTPIVHAALPVDHYPAGTWGPPRARSLLGDDVANWATQ